MAIEQLRRIGGVTYMDRGDGRLVPVSQGQIGSSGPATPPRADAPMSVSTPRRTSMGQRASGLLGEIPNMLNGTGIPERLAVANQLFNPVAGIYDSMDASGQMLAPNRTGYERAGSLAEMLTGLAGAAMPAVASARGGASGATALMESLLGGSPATQAVGDMARGFAADETGSLFPTRGMNDNGGPAISPYETLSLPAGSDPRYRGAAVDRAGGSFPRYAPKNTPARMQRLIDAANDPNSSLQSVFSQKVAKGQTLGGSDWYNTEELRDWFVSALGEEAGDAEWRDYISKIGATSTGSKVPSNIRIGSFYRALGDDAPRVAELVNEKGITPVQAAKELGISVSGLVDDGFGYGHLKQRGHAQNIVKQAEGDWEKDPPKGLIGAALTKWLQANPKVKGFTNSLLGDKKNIAADMHFMRLLAMSDASPDFLAKQATLSADNLAALRQTYGDAIEPYITVRDVKGKPVTEVKLSKAAKDGVIQDTKLFSDMPSAWADVPDATEYAAYEELAQRVAQQYGMTPAQFQANLWMGAGDLTNLADESQGTFMDLFRRALDAQAGRRGINREQMLDDFIRNKAPLAVAPVGVGLLGAGMQGRGDQGSEM